MVVGSWKEGRANFRNLTPVTMGQQPTRRYRQLPAAVAENNYYGFFAFSVLCKQETHNEQSPNEELSSGVTHSLSPRSIENGEWSTRLHARTSNSGSWPAFIHSFLSGFVVNNRFLILIILMPAAAFHLTYIFLHAVLWLKYFNYCQSY